MAIDLKAIIKDGETLIDAVEGLRRIALAGSSKIGGVSDLTTGQIQELKAAAGSLKTEASAAWTAFDIASKP